MIFIYHISSLFSHICHSRAYRELV